MNRLDAPQILALRTIGDGVLAAVAPLGLALAAGTALVVDLDPDGPAYPGESSLAELVADGPRRADLEPARPGVAVIRNGGVEPARAIDLVDTLARGWPRVVVRVGASAVPYPWAPLRPLFPGLLAPTDAAAAVWQSVGARVAAPGPGPVLPLVPRRVVLALLAGRAPARSRWVRAWRAVWELPWR